MFPPKLNQEKIKRNLNTPIINEKTEIVTKTLLTKKSPGPEGFTVEFYQTLKEDLQLILLKVFKKEGGRRGRRKRRWRRRRKKGRKRKTRRQRNIPNEHGFKNAKQSTYKQNSEVQTHPP